MSSCRFTYLLAALLFVVCWTARNEAVPANDSELQDEIIELRRNLTDVWKMMTSLSERLEIVEQTDKDDDEDDGGANGGGGSWQCDNEDDDDDDDDDDERKDVGSRNATNYSWYSIMSNTTSTLTSFIDSVVTGRGESDDDDDKDKGSVENKVKGNRHGYRRQQKQRRKCISRGGNRRSKTNDNPIEPQRNITAYCNMRPNKALPPERRADVRGRIYLVQKNRNQLHMNVKVSGLPDAEPRGRKYGIHVHEFGNLTNGCESAGKHFNPFNFNHSGPTTAKRHLGDLGNLESDERGIVDNNLQFDIEEALSGPNSFIGRAIVIHQLEDDLGSKPGDAGSLAYGNSGARLACCVIYKLN